ncbi:MAG: hypothetical protein Tsb0021_17130 [Chlamydiales bacterium]
MESTNTNNISKKVDPLYSYKDLTVTNEGYLKLKDGSLYKVIVVKDGEELAIQSKAHAEQALGIISKIFDNAKFQFTDLNHVSISKGQIQHPKEIKPVSRWDESNFSKDISKLFNEIVGKPKGDAIFPKTNNTQPNNGKEEVKSEDSENETYYSLPENYFSPNEDQKIETRSEKLVLKKILDESSEKGEKKNKKRLDGVRFEKVSSNPKVRESNRSSHHFIGNIDIEGKTIWDEYKDEEQTLVGKEEVTFIKTADIFLKGIQDKLDYLNTIIPKTEKEQEKLNREIALAKKQQEVIKHAKDTGDMWRFNSKTWDYIAHAFMDNGSPNQGLKAFSSLLPNLNREQLLDKDGNVVRGLNRSGAITDYSNGATDAETIEKLRNKAIRLRGKNSQNRAYQNFITENAKELRRIVNGPQALKSEGRFSRIRPPEFPFKNTEELIGFLEQELEDRTHNLENLYLQDLYTHLASQDLGQFKEGQPLEVIRLSLINSNAHSPEVLGKGFIRNETGQARDMQYIFKKLNGKKIILDGKGPYVDKDGHIHMPFKGPKELKLDTHLVNISISGNTKNEGIQQKINEKSFESIKGIIDRKIRERTEVLKNKGRDKTLGEDKRIKKLIQLKQNLTGIINSFTNPHIQSSYSAVAMGELLLELEVCLTVNCFSGKDRTPVVVSNLILNKLKNLKFGANNLATDLSQAWGIQMLNGIIGRVIRANTGKREPKLMPSITPLVGLTEGPNRWKKKAAEINILFGWIRLFLGIGQSVPRHLVDSGNDLDNVTGAMGADKERRTVKVITNDDLPPTAWKTQHVALPHLKQD